MAGKSLDPQVITTAVTNAMEQILSKIPGLAATAAPEIKELEIDDYEGRMKVAGVEKFNATSYISAINFYTNEADMKRRKGTKGVLVFYVESENAGKFFKGQGLSFNEDEDDASMLNACGQFAQVIAEAFKNNLASSGYGGLFTSQPYNFKNSTMEGIEFSADQKTKQEVSFFYWKHRTIVVEVSLADLPRK